MAWFMADAMTIQFESLPSTLVDTGTMTRRFTCKCSPFATMLCPWSRWICKLTAEHVDPAHPHRESVHCIFDSTACANFIIDGQVYYPVNVYLPRHLLAILYLHNTTASSTSPLRISRSGECCLRDRYTMVRRAVVRLVSTYDMRHVPPKAHPLVKLSSWRHNNARDILPPSLGRRKPYAVHAFS